MVVDASVIVAAAHRIEAAQRGLAAVDELEAPQLLPVEVAHALRRSVARKDLPADQAAGVLEDLAELGPRLHPHLALLDRMWALRNDLSAYDAAYLALAEALELPLLTLDRRLAAVAARTVEVVVPA